MRPTTWLGGAAAITIAACGLAVSSGVHEARAAAVSGNQQLRLTAAPASTSIFFIPCNACVLNSMPSGAHIGGAQIASGRLLDQRGHQVGHYSLTSVGATPFTQRAQGELMLTAVLVIGKDQLVAQGLEEPPNNHGTIAVTGGTGRFQSSRGEVTFTDHADGTDLAISWID